MAKRLLSFRVCVARSIYNHDNVTRVAQHNTQFAKLLASRGYIYCLLRSKQLPRFCEIMLAKFVLFCLFLFFSGKLRYENVYGDELLYLYFGYDTIIRRDLRTLSLPRDSPRDNHYACVIEVHLSPRGSRLLGGLSYEKFRRYNNSPPYVTARWPGGTQLGFGYGCATRSFDHHPITKPEKTQICNLCLNHCFLKGPF